MDQKPVNVALALVHCDDRWLVARRKPRAHLGSLWEFPGGKVQAGEHPRDAAARELREECGVEATPERLLRAVRWRYPDRCVLLIPVVCRWVRGAGRALESDECRWVSAAELAQLNMPAANDGIIAQLAAQESQLH